MTRGSAARDLAFERGMVESLPAHSPAAVRFNEQKVHLTALANICTFVRQSNRFVRHLPDKRASTCRPSIPRTPSVPRFGHVLRGRGGPACVSISPATPPTLS